MASGEMTTAEFADFLRTFLNQAARHSMDGSLQQLVNLIVWVKSNSGQGSSYRSQHELIAVFRAGDQAHLNNVALGKFGRNRSNVWQFAGANSFSKDRLIDLAMHPTVKPIGLLVEAIKDCTKRGDYVLDLFGGSGSTLLACEKIGRRGLLLEIEPRYVDSAVSRWQNYTGKDAIHASSSRTFDEVCEAASEFADPETGGRADD